MGSVCVCLSVCVCVYLRAWGECAPGLCVCAGGGWGLSVGSVADMFI